VAEWTTACHCGEAAVRLDTWPTTIINTETMIKEMEIKRGLK